MQISDSSSRILAGLLEARTGQQLTMSRRWRIETALSALLRERGISTLDELITILVMGKEPGLSNQVVEALLNNETYFFRDRARNGIYTQFEVQRGLAITQTVRWFEECEGGWRVVEPLRKYIRFQVHNLLEAPPHPGDFDIVLCRNVLLYLCSEKRALAFERLASSLAEDGWLMLGAGETVIGQTRKLTADGEARGLYRLDQRRDPSDRRTGEDRRATARG